MIKVRTEVKVVDDLTAKTVEVVADLTVEVEINIRVVENQKIVIEVETEVEIVVEEGKTEVETEKKEVRTEVRTKVEKETVKRNQEVLLIPQ